MNTKVRWERKLPNVPNAFVYSLNQNLLWIPWGSQREAGPKQGQSVDDWNFYCQRWCLKQGVGGRIKMLQFPLDFCPVPILLLGASMTAVANDSTWLWQAQTMMVTSRSHSCGCHNVHCWYMHASSHSLCQKDTGTHRSQSGIMGVQRMMVTADILAKLSYWREPCHFSISEGLRTEGHGWKITGVEVHKHNVYNCWKLVDNWRYLMWKKTFISSS